MIDLFIFYGAVNLLAVAGGVALGYIIEKTCVSSHSSSASSSRLRSRSSSTSAQRKKPDNSDFMYYSLWDTYTPSTSGYGHHSHHDTSAYGGGGGDISHHH